ncbi:hypothetical protein GW17_00026432 [Ensete ventricosum]|nr:hypothetical protein GW17_00026432 [Ensete ventricosum]
MTRLTVGKKRSKERKERGRIRERREQSIELIHLHRREKRKGKEVRLAEGGRRRRRRKKMGSKGDKSNFSQICRLWRQYLKEKGSLSGLGIDMAPVPAGEIFSQLHDFGGFCRQMEKGQLTIFYAGKVMVFDDFPAAKAKDLMQMASNESIAAQKISFSAPRAAASPSKLDSMLAAASGSQSMAAPSPDSPSKTSASDMPIARRNSLHRFLEKRKDRCVLQLVPPSVAYDLENVYECYCSWKPNASVC